MSDKILVAKTTSAVAIGSSDTIHCSTGETVVISIADGALTGAENVDIYYSVNGVDFNVLYDRDENPVVLKTTQPQVAVIGPGIYKVAKDATTNQVSVRAGKTYYDKG